MSTLVSDPGRSPASLGCADPGRVPGVYGLQLRGLEQSSVLSEVDGRMPALAVSVEFGRVTDRVERIDQDHAEISLIDDGWISLSRSGTAHMVISSPVPPDEIVHPWLVPAAATFNGWHGRQVLHGGVAARGGRAIAILGNKEGGKSSLLTWLTATGGLEILADDLVVIENRTVFAGPRCIDLRPGSEAADAIAAATSEQLIRDGSRLRVQLPPCSGCARLVGIVVLAWAEAPEPSLQRLSPLQGLSYLLPHAMRVAGDGDLLNLLDVPVWTLLRPRTWSSMPHVVERISGLLD